MESIEDENLSTEVTEEDINNGIEDEFGVVYSEDGKRLLKCKYGLGKYDIKNGTEIICDKAFCSSGYFGQQITIPNSVTCIGNLAFADCEYLQEITIPKSVIKIGCNPFVGCQEFIFDRYTKINIKSESSRFVVEDNMLIDNKEKRIISYFGQDNAVCIPNSITNIGEYSFNGCKTMQQITIPNSVVNIGEKAFLGCSLQQITIPDSVTRIGDFAFRSSSLRQVIIPNSVTIIGNYIFYKCNSLSQIDIPNSVTSIGEYAFAECKSLQQIIIPNSVINIGNRTFEGCESLWQLAIPNSVTNIGVCAFADCKTLKQFSIPDSVTNIGSSAFEGCKSLQHITLSNSLISIGSSTFRNCESLQQITIPDSVTNIGGSAFEGCKSLRQIIIPDTVTIIGYEAFLGCESLQQVTIPNSVTSIEDNTFLWCKSLQKIIIPDSVTSIGNSAFYGCSLQQIIVSQGSTIKFKEILPQFLWTKICEQCIEVNENELNDGFKDEFGVVYSNNRERLLKCENKELDYYEIKTGTKAICDIAFKNCSSLVQISIPYSITAIGDGAFDKCISLQQINIDSKSSFVVQNNMLIDARIGKLLKYFGRDICAIIPKTVTTIGSKAFDDCSTLRQIIIPTTVTTIEAEAFENIESLQQIFAPRLLRMKCRFKLPGKLQNKFAVRSITSVTESEITDGIKDEFGCIYSKDGERLLKYNPSNCKTYIIKSGTIFICDYSFDLKENNELSELLQIVIPNTAKFIGYKAFNCPSIRQIVMSDSVSYIGNNAFDNSSLQKIIVPKGTTEKFKEMLPEELWNKLIENQ